MTDEIVTPQQLIDASLDCETIKQVVSGDDQTDVTSRLGQEMPTLSKALRLILQQSMDYYSTQAALLASTPIAGTKAATAMDTRKVWLYNGTTWVDTGLSTLDLAKAYAQEKGVVNTLNADLNTYTKDQIAHITTGTIARSLVNAPPDFSEGGVLICKNTNNDVVHQSIITKSFLASRFGTRNGTTWTYNEWTGLKSTGNGIVNYSVMQTDVTALKTDVATLKEQKAFSLNEDIRKTVSGIYHIPTTLVMRSLLNKPEGADSGGILIVQNSATSQTTHSTLINNQGMWTCFRAAATWNPWVFHPNQKYVDDYVDLKTSGIVSKRNDITTFGSSTLAYLEDELSAMCLQYGRVFHPAAVSGDTLANIMLAQGSNVATATFPSGVIPANGVTVPVNITFTNGEPSAIGYSESRYKLENGIVGVFTKVSDGNYTFKPSNNATALDVSGVELNLYNHMFNDLQDTIHIINAGKNNIGSALTAKQIYDANVEIIDFIAKPRRFIMVGHFSNTGATADHIAKVNELNRLIKAKSAKYYVDVKEILYADATFTSLGITKTQADIDAIARDTLPPSLSRDASHLSPAMDILLADKIEAKLLELGYL